MTVELQPLIVKANVIADTQIVKPKLSIAISSSSDIQTYDGEYTVTPSDDTQVLETSGKRLRRDIIVEAVPDSYRKWEDFVSAVLNNTIERVDGLPQGATKIKDYFFYNCTNLTDVSITGITEIGGSAFTSCRKLASITIGEGLETIGSSAFTSCIVLREIELPDSIRIINSMAFNSCSNLRKIVIGSSCESIGAIAFNSCINLRDITVKATTPPTIQANTFNSVPNDAIISVPSGSVDLYKNAQYWSARSGQIVAIA